MLLAKDGIKRRRFTVSLIRRDLQYRYLERRIKE